MANTPISVADHRRADDLEGRATPERSFGWAGWLLSGTMHGLLLCILCGIYWKLDRPALEIAPLRMRPPSAATDPTLPQEIGLGVPVTVVDNLTVDTSGEIDASSNVSDGGARPAKILGTHANQDSLPLPQDRYRAMRVGHGQYGSDAVVEHALCWFKRHQSPDGRWDAVNYYANCSETGPKCEPGLVAPGALHGVNVAMTGYAVLCFLIAGSDHVSPNQFRLVVKKGLEYLISAQKADGQFGERNDEHAIASLALAEAYCRTKDPMLKDPVQRAINQILAHQNQAAGIVQGPGTITSDGAAGLGWDYVGPSTRNDTSVSGWNVMALTRAVDAGLNVGTGLNGAKIWLDRAWKQQNPDWRSLDPSTGESRFPYTWDSATGRTEIVPAPVDGQPSRDDQDLSCVGGLCAVFLDHHNGDPMLESLANYVFKHQLPASYPCNLYALYFNTLTMSHVRGERWQAWNGRVRDMLVKAVHTEPGCMNGSFDWSGTCFPGHETGRLLSTAYCTLCLEVYYKSIMVLDRDRHQLID